MKDRKLKIAYLSGPVDARNVHRSWSQGEPMSYFGTSYLSQYFDICAELNARGYVVTILPKQQYAVWEGDFLIENRPLPTNLTGVMYHLAMLFWFVRWLPRLIHFKPDVLIVTALQNHWFLFFCLRWFGVSIIPSVHSLIWLKFRRVRLRWRFLYLLNRLLFWPQVVGVLAVSEDIAGQIRLLAKRSARVFLPTYRPSQFFQVELPVQGKRFCVFYAGRIEENKGVFDLYTVAQQAETEMPGDFQFDVCGDGSELERLRSYGDLASLCLHGVCSPDKLLSILSKSHVVIVPTRTTCEEGFNKVCAEAILAGRPVITSAVCPALATIRDAAVEVAPDDVDGYYRAILRLRDDPAFYEQKRRACGPLQAQFYDVNNSWGAHLRAVLKDCGIIDQGATHDGRRARGQ